jgi:DNA-directed RNA polymerase alpha subunit
VDDDGLETLPLRNATVETLQRVGLLTIGDLRHKRAEELRGIPGFTGGQVAEIASALAKRGLRLAGDDGDE